MTKREKAHPLAYHHRPTGAHRPFSDPACRKIFALLRPGYLVHDLAITTPEGMAAALRQQRALIGSTKAR